MLISRQYRGNGFASHNLRSRIFGQPSSIYIIRNKRPKINNLSPYPHGLWAMRSFYTQRHNYLRIFLANYRNYG
jgi:hypothetical protein